LTPIILAQNNKLKRCQARKEETQESSRKINTFKSFTNIEDKIQIEVEKAATDKLGARQRK
jgi:hypothetical protein